MKIQLQISPLKFTVDWRINVMLGMSTTFLSIHNGVESKKDMILSNTMYILGKHNKPLDEGGL